MAFWPFGKAKADPDASEPPLRPGDVGRLEKLSRRPNPAGLVFVFRPKLSEAVSFVVGKIGARAKPADFAKIKAQVVATAVLPQDVLDDDETTDFGFEDYRNPEQYRRRASARRATWTPSPP